MDTQSNIQSNKEQKPHSFIKISVVVAIIIISNMFLNYTASLVFNEPVNEAYKNTPQVVEPITSKEKCISVGGQWTENAFPNEKGKTEVQGSCYAEYSKQKAYDEAMKVFNRNVFVFLIIVGVLLIAISSFVGVQLLSVSSAWSGILSLLIASIRYWSDADTWAKLVILGLALCLLIWVTIKKINK